METKICKTCNQVFPATDEFFYRANKGKNLHPYCKTCHLAKNRIARDKWRIEKADEIEAYAIEYRATHKEQEKERNKRYYAENRDAELARKKTPEAKLRIKGYYDPIRQKVISAKKKAPGEISVEDIQKMMEEQYGKCAYCGDEMITSSRKKRPTLEHIIPISKGGTNDRINLCMVCFSCNSSKQDTPVHIWRIKKFGNSQN